MPHHFHRGALALCTIGMFALGVARAENFSRDVYTGAKDEIRALYKSELKACDSYSGNAKDVCEKEAKGREKVGQAQLEYNYTGKADDRRKVAQAKWEARYDVAKERCEDLGGNAKDVCEKQAKADEDKAKADAKAARASQEAQQDAWETKMKADYRVAAEQCESRAGQAKDVCVASAKARYGQN